ncbi:hypothetical protein BKA67DRAFT_662554 [Truncatella angustata]|uniref:Heterokaryon incompatibility domain-containing protein n=1 Tax=Truncatella angustata TaxID=152316 RepID=A0A9P8RKM1_9PEZI|nr:uncharacterized protein BKA67DRAFT_662554 [Truncatella angustata]KAH6647795.1 hypothetical protein BKA67DRAFT_662554 [Truncatella angustata]
MPSVPSFDPSLDEEKPLERSLGNSIFEVTLTRNNRVGLFKENVERLNLSNNEAHAALGNLRLWAPDFAKAFKVRDRDSLLNTPFRLVCQSDVGKVPFDEENVIRQYLAVSYCWRHPDHVWPKDDSKPYAPWPFSQPFVEAVLAERGVHTDTRERDENFRREGIWIDQMCIRQEDEVEKQQCIAMMDIIYDRCRRLLILLEDVCFEAEEVAVLEKYDNPSARYAQDGDFLPDQADIPQLVNVCAAVENSRWWSRAWCWHEFEVNKPWSDMRHHYYAHNAIFIARTTSACDNGAMTYGLKYSTLEWARSVTIYNVRAAAGYEFSPKELRWTISDNSVSPYNDPAQRGVGTIRSSLMASYFIVSPIQCTIPSDIVSITINLAGLAVHFTGHSQDYDMVFFTVSMLALACGEKRPLTWMANTQAKDSAMFVGKRDNVSWLSRPSGGLETALPEFTVGSVQGIHSITLQQINLDLLFFESPVEIIADEEMAKTYELFPDNCIRSREVRLRDGRLDLTSTSIDDDKYNPLRRCFLAAVCRLGLEGICRLWTLLDKEVVQPSFNNVRFVPFDGDEALRLSARKLLDWLSTPSAVDSFPTSSQSYSDYEEILLLLLTFITDPRALYLVGFPCGLIRCSKQSHAIVGYPVLRDLSLYRNPAQLRLAMPTDLVAYPSNVTRAWILQPLDEKGEDFSNNLNKESKGLCESAAGRWRLVGKTVLLGGPDEVPLTRHTQRTSSQYVTVRTKQIVQG